MKWRCKARLLFQGLHYVIRCGIAWRAMSNDLPPGLGCISKRSASLGPACSTRSLDLRAVLRLAAGRGAEPAAAIIDSRTHYVRRRRALKLSQ